MRTIKEENIDTEHVNNKILDKYCAYIEWSERYDLHKISQEELGTNLKYLSLEEFNNILSRIEAINSILYQSTIMRTVDKYAKEYLDLGYIYKGDLEQWKADFRETLDCEFWQNNNIVNTFDDKGYKFDEFELAFFGYHKTKFSFLDKKAGNIVFTERWDIGDGRCGKGSFLNELKDLDLSKETIASFYNSYDTCKGFDDFKAVFSELAKTKIEDILTKEDYDLIHVYKWSINKQINELECIKSKKNLIDNLKQWNHQKSPIDRAKTASQRSTYKNNNLNKNER